MSFDLYFPPQTVYQIGKAVQSVESNLRQSDKKLIACTGALDRCIRGYSVRTGFFGKLSGIIYRICNAIKAIFGRSDWQMAKKSWLEYKKVSKLDAERFFEEKKEGVESILNKLCPNKKMKVNNFDDYLKARIAIYNEIKKSPIIKDVAKASAVIFEQVIKLISQGDVSDKDMADEIQENFEIFKDEYPCCKKFLEIQNAAEDDKKAIFDQYIDSDPIAKKLSEELYKLVNSKNLMDGFNVLLS